MAAALASFTVAPLAGDDVLIEPLRRAAAVEGLRLLERLIDEWKSGASRFDGPGETLVGVRCADALVGVGGLTHDPYEPAPRRARLRHLYVRPAFRRQGAATALVNHLIGLAGSNFDEIRLRTDSVAAASFYERLGFERSASPTATHVLRLASRAPRPPIARPAP